MRNDRGSAVALLIIGLGLVAALATLIAGFAIFVHVVRAQHAVEQAALLAVDSTVGRMPGEPCEVATEYLARQGFKPENCRIYGYESRVEVRVTWAAMSWLVHAHAGLESTSP